ncbi:hypothetical protein ACQPYE_02780 [Actinosynnema sp. CA-299493]
MHKAGAAQVQVARGGGVASWVWSRVVSRVVSTVKAAWTSGAIRSGRWLSVVGSRRWVVKVRWVVELMKVLRR